MTNRTHFVAPSSLFGTPKTAQQFGCFLNPFNGVKERFANDVYGSIGTDKTHSEEAVLTFLNSTVFSFFV